MTKKELLVHYKLTRTEVTGWLLDDPLLEEILKQYTKINKSFRQWLKV